MVIARIGFKDLTEGADLGLSHESIFQNENLVNYRMPLKAVLAFLGYFGGITFRSAPSVSLYCQ